MLTLCKSVALSTLSLLVSLIAYLSRLISSVLRGMDLALDSLLIESGGMDIASGSSSDSAFLSDTEMANRREARERLSTAEGRAEAMERIRRGMERGRAGDVGGGAQVGLEGSLSQENSNTVTSTAAAEIVAKISERVVARVAADSDTSEVASSSSSSPSVAKSAISPTDSVSSSASTDSTAASTTDASLDSATDSPAGSGTDDSEGEQGLELQVKEDVDSVELVLDHSMTSEEEESLVCPISFLVYRDPVIIASGNTFDREMIQK